MERIEISSVKTGMRFSKPVFFDDAKNMFIESGITVKPYHISTLTRWSVPFLLSDGHPLAEGEEPVEELEALDTADDIEEVEEVSEIEEAEEIPEAEEVEELEDLDDVEDIEEL